ncbi:M1 family metallopeptidase [Wenyingzhuangia sp. chi5]|uniref:M1 family metallopeptidase n=1 Tax=Wenyingzhuangia gilva TaxID=3057677 RepID=A0ABT8VPK8_9FLAO|nr:M1 family metallopeptidase [Wenyingzhuangia sp. chi5]MDO3693903.1 M1 family metallopeptidase [Wenyingzhuangia sp. chi5]
MKKVFVILGLISLTANAQYWQQKTDYTMDIDMDVKTHQYTGKQEIEYRNNSPETLTKVYYHLYNNAFQPGSAMDMRVQNIPDPNGRLIVNTGTKESPVNKSKISLLAPEEQGYIKVKSLTQDGKPLKYVVEGTILEVELAKPLKSGKKTELTMEFEGQIPLQVRRSGRDNAEGVALSMTQWYPKLAAYDDEGWHANPYIGAEFFADWGDYEVNITIDKNYTVGGTGYLQNVDEVGHGYENKGDKVNQKVVDGKLTWEFKAPNVHDFSWAADPDFKHLKHKVTNGPEVHFLYKNSLADDRKESWEKLPGIMDQLFAFYQENVGEYPYKQYSVIQGGDGGMEYAMCTLITGDRDYRSLVGVVAHELAHTWFQFLLASNETKHAWQDEGFTTYISTLIENKIFEDENGFDNVYKSYASLVGYGIEQPLTTNGDEFDYSYGYGVSTYNKGALFLCQLKYIIGEDAFKNTLKNYYKEYVFKHPKPEDFIRIAEKASNMELDWYLNHWTETTKTIDYEVFPSITNQVNLHNKGTMEMPVEVTVTYEDDSQELFYIPLARMRGEKKINATLLKDWNWTNPVYTFPVTKTLKKVEIDIQNQTADIDRKNNVWVKMVK